MSITLNSQDGISFNVDISVANQSQLLKNMMEDVQDSTNVVIPIPNVTSSILKRVLEYCDYHKNSIEESSPIHIEEFESNKNRPDKENPFDLEFISSLSTDDLFDVITASNYLDIKGLLDLGCKHVANKIKGKSPQEIRTLFNVENDFTPEEEERIKRENEWASDS